MKDVGNRVDSVETKVARNGQRETTAPKATDTTLSAFIWKNTEDLWGDFRHTDFGNAHRGLKSAPYGVRRLALSMR